MKFGFLIFFTLISFHSTFAQDQGGMGSGGGYVYCADYQDMVGRISSALVTMGQDKIDDVNKVIRADELWAIKKVLTCLPVSELDRQARSNPTSKHTDLLVNKYNGIIPWQNLSKSEQMRLASHELAVLAGYENDGEYFVSESINALLKKYAPQFKLIYITADQVISNPDGSITLFRPYVLGPDGQKYYVGNEYDQRGYATTTSESFSICQYFFGYARTAPGRTTEAQYGPNQIFAEMGYGVLRGLWKIHADPGYFIRYFETVTCTF